jgi:hypothetical protein
MYNRRNEAREERQQQKLESSSISKHFPEVSGIVISMTYNQKNLKKPLMRTVNFFPDSHAFFIVECLHKGCNDGGFDLTRRLTSMIRKNTKSEKGNLSCEGDGPSSDHSSIHYEINIQYT